jgi:hypothetical protein
VLFCWVEQVADSPERAALLSRLHQRGKVVGQGPDVRFQREGRLISVPPHLLRLLPDAAFPAEPGSTPISSCGVDFSCEFGTGRCMRTSG